MTETQYLLNVVEEECCETGQRASKAIRFTPEEIQDGQELTNAQRLVYEFNDILAAMEMLQERGVIQLVIDREAIEKKKEKIIKYMNYSRSLGVVEP